MTPYDPSSKSTAWCPQFCEDRGDCCIGRCDCEDSTLVNYIMAKSYSFDLGLSAYIEIRAKTTECRLSGQILKTLELRGEKLSADENIVGRVNVDTSKSFDARSTKVKLKINNKIHEHKFTVSVGCKLVLNATYVWDLLEFAQIDSSLQKCRSPVKYTLTAPNSQVILDPKTGKISVNTGTAYGPI